MGSTRSLIHTSNAKSSIVCLYAALYLPVGKQAHVPNNKGIRYVTKRSILAKQPTKPTSTGNKPDYGKLTHMAAVNFTLKPALSNHVVCMGQEKVIFV